MRLAEPRLLYRPWQRSVSEAPITKREKVWTALHRPFRRSGYLIYPRDMPHDYYLCDRFEPFVLYYHTEDCSPHRRGTEYFAEWRGIQRVSRSTAWWDDHIEYRVFMNRDDSFSVERQSYGCPDCSVRLPIHSLTVIVRGYYQHIYWNLDWVHQSIAAVVACESCGRHPSIDEVRYRTVIDDWLTWHGYQRGGRNSKIRFRFSTIREWGYGTGAGPCRLFVRAICPKCVPQKERQLQKEIEWLEKGKSTMRDVRRLLRNPNALPSRTEASTPVGTLRR